MNKTGAKNIRVLRGVEDEKAFEKGLNNTTTARDLMIILRRIAERRAVSTWASQEMISILSAQKSRAKAFRLAYPRARALRTNRINYQDPPRSPASSFCQGANNLTCS
ncbi:MAG: serine hydrolase [Pyrinomonadaceae bacterium]